MNKIARPSTPFEADYHQWSVEQAAHLRAGRFDVLDCENLAQEIENLGRSEKREIESRLEILLMHLLKWHFQPERRTRSWRLTIKVQRSDLQTVLDDNPSLQSYPAQRLVPVYLKARLAAETETGLPFESFPEVCPFTMDEILSQEFPA